MSDDDRSPKQVLVDVADLEALRREAIAAALHKWMYPHNRGPIPHAYFEMADAVLGLQWTAKEREKVAQVLRPYMTDVEAVDVVAALEQVLKP